MPINKFTFTFFKNDKKILEEEYENESQNVSMIKFHVFDYETIINFDKKLFTRENKEYFFSLNMQEKVCELLLKNENLMFPIEVDYCDILENQNQYIIEYSIESEDAKIKMVISKGD